ncbi:response regulator transcription factor [Azospira restricta]|uniref:Response regulator transcription factor n=1 Tax=Azospira restricta TaxID=404405 RepID=A0A974Y559_9RHOO|nr:response regulator transcription factor [Azospira restricta]QRJ65016.1 response regulator transcription factor [Azospira restricta]
MRVLLIEDDELLADGVTRALRYAGYVVEWAADGRRADAWLSEREYDVVILDLGLPGLDGSEVLKRLRGRKQEMPVLVVSAREMLDERIRLLDLGADDYLVKPVAIAELEARIRALTRRGYGKADPVLRLGNLDLDTAARRAWIGDQALDLTAREWSALEFLALRANRIVSKDLVMQSLYNWDEEITPNAVEKIISRLRTKLEPAGVNIRTVRGMGYYLEKPKSPAS